MPNKIDNEFDLNRANNRVVLDVSQDTSATGQITLLTDSTPSAFVVTFKRSNDGETWAALESAQSISYTAFSASQLSVMTGAINCSGFRFLAAEVTTAEGSALTGRVHIYSQNTQ